MEFIIGFIIGLVLVFLFTFVSQYNKLKNLMNTTTASLHNIDIQLKRRFDLIPNLIETVKGYAKHEKEIFEEVTQMRASISGNISQSNKNSKQYQTINNELNSAVSRLLAVAENYPNLKADSQFLNLQQELTNTEDQISSARRIYNNNVKIINTAIESIPTCWFVGFAHATRFEYLEFEEAISEVPKVSF